MRHRMSNAPPQRRPQPCRSLFRLTTVAALVAGVSASFAQGTEAAPTGLSSLRWSGFATLGITHHGNETAGAIASFAQKSPARDGWSGNLDTVGGLQLDLRLLEGTTLTAQAVARAGDNFAPKVRMAYLRQQFGEDAAIRVGRYRSPLYLDSDVSEIGFAYLAARPAMPVYGVAANYVPHIDGADVQWRHSFGSAGLMIQGYLGRSSGQQVFHNTSPRDEADFSMSNIRGVAISLGLPQVTLRASRTSIDRFTLRSPLITQLNTAVAQTAAGVQAVAGDPRLPAALQAALLGQAQAIQGFANPFDTQPTYSSVGIDANLDRWRVVAEWVTFDTPSSMVGKYRGAQATVGYSWGAFTPYVGVARNLRRGGLLNTQALSPTGLSPALDGGIAQLKGALDGAALFTDLSSRSASLGVRWEARDNLAVKVQFDRLTTPSPTVPGVMAVPKLPFDNRLRLFSASLNIVF